MATSIPGYAFKPNERKIGRERLERYQQLNRKDIKINRIRPRYAKTVYEGELKNPDLTDLDILLLCDGGNTCFGGTVRRDGDAFTATVYTD